MFKIETNTDKSSLKQNQKIFDIYNIYRVLLSLILLTSFLFRSDISFLGSIDPLLYSRIIWLYLGFNIIVMFRRVLPALKTIEITQYAIVILIDILILALIGYTCGGVTSGMALLLIMPIAAGSILFSDVKTSTFLAAVASISAIYTEIYLSFSFNRELNYYFQAGLLGGVLFLISLFLQYLRNLIKTKELFAIEQAESIQSLEEMNQQILQRMLTGIIVIDSNNLVLNANSSAQQLLQVSSVSTLPSILLKQLDTWKKNKEILSAPFKVSNSSPQIQANFSYLNPEGGSNILIFLEDYSLLNSRAQHLKLMSLGRLTASIAHEIRNPLGAISHANQLLGESTNIPQDDQRLVEIIDTHTIRVNSIIDNILQLSRNESSVSELIPLKPWIFNFIEKFSSSFKDEIDINVQFESDDIAVRFNPSQLEQIMNNLCENGIRASSKTSGRAVLLIQASTNSRNQRPRIDIIDEGEGIPSENEEKIFEPFFTTETTGTGLGLFICKEICEANRAQLSYQRNSDHKTCFSISFAHPDKKIA